MKNHTSLNTIAYISLIATLGGCAANSDRYPSLAIRDFERVQGTFEVVGEDEAYAPPASAIESEIRQASELLVAARIAHQEFVDSVPHAEQKLAAARGLGPDDTDWTDGQLALADLDTKRSKVAIYLANLDLMFAEASLSYRELNEIDDARRIVRQFVEEQDSILGKLAAGSR